MDIIIKPPDSVQIGVSQQTPEIKVKPIRQIGLGVTALTVAVTPKRTRSVLFNFVQDVIATKGVVRCTSEQYQSLAYKDESTWYAVTNSSGALRKLYLGTTLFAKADSSGSMGFPYTFPLTFTS